MGREDDHTPSLPSSFQGLDYSADHHEQNLMMTHGSHQMVDYLLNQTHQFQNPNSGFCSSSPLDQFDMQFAEFGPNLALNLQNQSLVLSQQKTGMAPFGEEGVGPDDDHEDHEEEEAPMVHTNEEKGIVGNSEGKNKRKRGGRSVKTRQQVESQRMTHIAVERNRRKQMNEHLLVLRSLMPPSYVQRGDQASIIGGAIEFVRELEQLLQCLESQKRRRLGDEPPPPPPPPATMAAGGSYSYIPNEEVVELEETAESKSCMAEIQVKLMGFDAIIKILSKRRPGQLITTIAALEDLHLHILHTNITTIEQTVLYSFNVKVVNEVRFTAEDIATSVQQIFSFLHANSSI